MILSVVTAESQSTLPLSVREALGLKEGDRLAYVIEQGLVGLRKFGAEEAGELFSPCPTFTEWLDDRDAVFDDL